MNKQELSEIAFEAIENAGYIDEYGFVNDLITVAFDKDATSVDDVRVAQCDYRSFYNNYDYNFTLSADDTIDSIRFQIEMIDMLQEA